MFYASGRASLEASYMYALMARLYGSNNLPDSSNVCHESTSFGVPRRIGVPACQREWKTPTGKADFICPPSLDEDDDMTARGPDVIRLTTLRSFDQFNTTMYGDHDRFRGIHGTRHVLLMNDEDIAQRGFVDGQMVRATTASSDGGLRIVRYDIPRGCAAGYFPELNPLVPLWHHAVGSQVPAYKAIPIRVSRM